MKNVNRAKWITDRYIIIMLGLFPLYCGKGYEDVSAPRAWMFIILTALWLAAVLFFMFLAMIKKEEYKVRLRPAHYCVIAFVFLAAVSAVFSPYWDTTWFGTDLESESGQFDGFVTIFLYGAIFIGVSLLASPKRLYGQVFLFSAAICALIAVVQLCGLNIFGLYPDGSNYYDKYGVYNGAFLGTVGNSALMGQYMCLALPVAAVCTIDSKSRKEKIILSGMTILFLIVLAATQAEAAYVGLAGCIFIATPLLVKEKRLRRNVVIFEIVLILAGLMLIWFWPGNSGTVWELSRILHGDVREEFGSHRIQIWREALLLVPEKFWLGAGPGTLVDRLFISWSRYIEELGTSRTVSVTNAFNAYLSYLCNQGFLGMTAYCAALISSLMTWIMRRFSDVSYRAIGCAMICCCIQDFFCLVLCSVTPLMWVLWALLETSKPAELLIGGQIV